MQLQSPSITAPLLRMNEGTMVVAKGDRVQCCVVVLSHGRDQILIDMQKKSIFLGCTTEHGRRRGNE